MVDIPEDPRQGLTLTQALWAAIDENGDRENMIAAERAWISGDQPFRTIEELQEKAWETLAKHLEAGRWQMMVASTPLEPLMPIQPHAVRHLDLEAHNGSVQFWRTIYPIVFVYRAPMNSQESARQRPAAQSARHIEVRGLSIPENAQVQQIARLVWDHASEDDRANVTALADETVDEFNAAAVRFGSNRQLKKTSMRTNLNTFKNPPKK